MLTPGTHLGAFEILSALGAGGMGEVYKARDTRLNRTVAVKVLRQQVSGNPDLRARFEREAQTIAALNHPHICTLYDVGQDRGVDYLVMEYLEGETLSARLARGPLPADQVLKFASQIADALDKAHRKGVVHRDLKPGNVMLTATGTKLLDFGLAKLRPSTPADELKTLATEEGRTAAGTILGTLQYMAPEQLEGEEADARSDIFAFGALLFEMAAGRRAFTGKSQASLVSAILTAQPPAIASIQAGVPAAVDRIIHRCLEKDPENRWQNARDIALDLLAVPEEAGSTNQAATPRRFFPIAVLIAVSTVLAIAVLFGVWRMTSVEKRPAWSTGPVRFAVYPPPNTAFAGDWNVPFAVSPDGRRLVFVGISSDGKKQLWLRPLDSDGAQPVPGTEDATGPFWSPDSQWIGFFTEDKLKKVSASGGAAQIIASGSFRFLSPNATWSADGTIVFAPGPTSGLFRVSDHGSQSSSLTTIDSSKDETVHDWPQFLKDGKHFIYSKFLKGGNRGSIHLASTDSPASEDLMSGALSTLGYMPGYVLFVDATTLLARPFDDKGLKFSGEAIRVADGIPRSGPGRAAFSISTNGVLAYWPSLIGNAAVFQWFQRDGAPGEKITPPAKYTGFSVDPGGRRLVFSRWDEKGARDLWLVDLLRGAVSRLTFDGDSMSPVWSPDGNTLAFASARDTPPNLYVRVMTGGDKEQRLTTSGLENYPTSWSSDGHVIVYEIVDPKTHTDLWFVEAKENAKPTAFLQTPFDESAGKLSPGGKWIAYVSNESGRNEVYVAGFPSGQNKRQVSVNGGSSINWRADGKELFYVFNGDLMAAAITAAETFLEAGIPQKLFRISSTSYTVTPDGKRFLVEVNVPDPDTPPITVVLNWPAALNK